MTNIINSHFTDKGTRALKKTRKKEKTNFHTYIHRLPSAMWEAIMYCFSAFKKRVFRLAFVFLFQADM